MTESEASTTTDHPLIVIPRDAQHVLPIVDFADEAVVENADLESRVARRGDGVIGMMTDRGVAHVAFARHGDGWLRAA